MPHFSAPRLMFHSFTKAQSTLAKRLRSSLWWRLGGIVACTAVGYSQMLFVQQHPVFPPTGSDVVDFCGGGWFFDPLISAMLRAHTDSAPTLHQPSITRLSDIRNFWCQVAIQTLGARWLSKLSVPGGYPNFRCQVAIQTLRARWLIQTLGARWLSKLSVPGG